MDYSTKSEIPEFTSATGQMPTSRPEKRELSVSGDVGGNATRILLTLTIVGGMIGAAVWGLPKLEETQRQRREENAAEAAAHEAEREQQRRDRANQSIIEHLHPSKVEQLAGGWGSGTGSDRTYYRDLEWRDVDYYVEEDSLGYLVYIDFWVRSPRSPKQAIVRFSKDGTPEKCISIESVDY